MQNELLIALNNVSPTTLLIADLVSKSIYLMILLVVLISIKKSREKGIFTGIIIFSSFLISTLLKMIFNVERPYNSIDGLNILGEETSNSFPSRHSQVGFTAATMSLKFKNLLYAWALLISISRLVLGVHHISDVVTGIIIGYLIAKISIKKKEKISRFLYNKNKI